MALNSEFEISKLGLIERMRLQQEEWQGPNGALRLAQLLSTFLNNPEVPFTTYQPITMRPPEGVAPLQIRGFGNGDLVFSITNTNGNTVGTVTFDSNNGLVSKNADGKTVSGGGGSSGSGGTTIPCTVTGGSGQTYTVNIYRNGRSGAAQQVTATVPNEIEDDIPAGYMWFVVALSDGTYELNPAVWIA
jgi:hypothetical protein